MDSNLLIKEYHNTNKYGDLLGISVSIPKLGNLECSMLIEDKHLATPIAAHGGAIASLVDSSLGIVCLSVAMQEGKVVSTIELSVKFLKPVFKGDFIKAYSEVISRGKRIYFAETRLYNQHNDLIASGAGTFNAYPMEKAGYELKQ